VNLFIAKNTFDSGWGQSYWQHY